MRSLIPLRRRHDCEWIGGRYTLPTKVREGDALVQPEVVMWLELPTGVIVGSRMSLSREPVPFGETLKEAMRSPLEGSPRQPSRIRVPDRQLAEALAGVIGSEVPVVVAPVPELDAVFDGFSVLAEAEPNPNATYLDGGATSPAVVARLFTAASLLFRAAPWRHVGEDQILRVDIPRLDVDGACLTISGESCGLLLFRSIEAYETLARAPLKPPGEEDLLTPRADRETLLLALSFGRKKELPPPMLREIEHHRWPVAGAKGYPLVMGVDADARPKIATEGDLRVLTACTSAFLAFFARHRAIFDTDDPETVCESFTGDDDLTVTLTAPYGPSSHSDVEDFFTSGEDALVDITPAAPGVGRNDPCPCGSGKKYKKCHLDTGRASESAPSGVETVQQMESRLVHAIGRFAQSRFGPAWLGGGAEDFDGDDSSLPIFIPWVVWTAVAAGERVADSFLEQSGERLSDEERDWFAAQRRSWLSVWEVTRVESGVIDLRDLLTGERRSVRDALASRSVVVRDTLLARVVDFRGLSLFGGLHARPLPPMDASEVIGGIRSKLRKRKGDVAVERLRDPLIGLFMIHRWRDGVDELVARASIPPVLQTTDGDPLLFVTESFQFDAEARPEIEKRLAAMDGVDDVRIKDGESEVVFVRPGNAIHRSWENTVVGRVLLGHDSLRIETTSVPRADALRVRVRDACGGMLRGGPRKTKDPTAMHTARRDAAQREAAQGGARKLPAARSPREEALLREVKETHYREWIDTPVPALGGKTPRAAARSATSRQRLDLLLREMENQENHLPEASRFDIGLLRHELGLDP